MQKKNFTNISVDVLNNVLNTFIQLEIFEEKIYNKQKEYNLLIIGVGTTGSHLVDGIVRNNLHVNLFLVDSDKVDDTNILRQTYYVKEIGEYKTETLQKRFPNYNISDIKIFVDNKDSIIKLCKMHSIDLVIQCGDQPTPRYLGNIVNRACDILNIPYIINTGYMSNVVALPEFYYPRNEYNFNYKHEVGNEVLLHTQVLEKARYSIAIQPTFIMLKQIEDYINGRTPIYYQCRGYYNEETLLWEVEKIE